MMQPIDIIIKFSSKVQLPLYSYTCRSLMCVCIGLNFHICSLPPPVSHLASFTIQCGLTFNPYITTPSTAATTTQVTSTPETPASLTTTPTSVHTSAQTVTMDTGNMVTNASIGTSDVTDVSAQEMDTSTG